LSVSVTWIVAVAFILVNTSCSVTSESTITCACVASGIVGTGGVCMARIGQTFVDVCTGNSIATVSSITIAREASIVISTSCIRVTIMASIAFIHINAMRAVTSVS